MNHGRVHTSHWLERMDDGTILFFFFLFGGEKGVYTHSTSHPAAAAYHRPGELPPAFWAATFSSGRKRSTVGSIRARTEHPVVWLPHMSSCNRLLDYVQKRPNCMPISVKVTTGPSR